MKPCIEIQWKRKKKRKKKGWRRRRLFLFRNTIILPPLREAHAILTAQRGHENQHHSTRAVSRLDKHWFFSAVTVKLTKRKGVPHFFQSRSLSPTVGSKIYSLSLSDFLSRIFFVRNGEYFLYFTLLSLFHTPLIFMISYDRCDSSVRSLKCLCSIYRFS